MKIFVEKHLNNTANPMYKLDHIEDGEKVLNLIKNGILILSDIISLDIGNINEINRPCLCIIKTFMVDNGDYNWEDEYEPYYEEENNYIEIFYCPITGEKIEFIISKEIDDTEIINQILNEIEKLKKQRKSKKRDLEIKELYSKLQQYESSNFNF